MVRSHQGKQHFIREDLLKSVGLKVSSKKRSEHPYVQDIARDIERKKTVKR